MDRVLLGRRPDGTSGLFVSKPGFDVKTASSENMLFDTRLGHYGSVLISGSASAGSTIYFGATLSYIPLVFVVMSDGGQIGGTQFYSRAASPSEATGSYPSVISGQQAAWNPSYMVTKSYLQILKPDWYNDSSAHNYTVRYIVWRCPGA